MSLLPRLRLVLALAGMAFLIAGIARDSQPMVWVAIILLGLAFGIRLYWRKKEP